MEEKIELGAVASVRKKSDNSTEKSCISVSGILKNLKRFFALWIAVSVFVSLLTLLVSSLIKQDSYKKTEALVSFTYSGIEKGLDPNGNKFNINTMKSDQIIERALNDLNLTVEDRDSVRRSISFEGIIPSDTVDRITNYKNIFEESDTDSTVDQVLDSTYYPTQYKVYFDYAPTGLSGNEAAELLNHMLECYNDYFLEKYGYNKSLENSVTAIDYREYDYAEAIDVFESELSKLATYVNQVSSTDTTRFKSQVTGHTFADLTAAIGTYRDVDLERIASNITLNTITKDKK